MSADIWLEHGGDTVVVDDTTFNLTYNLTPMLCAAGMPAWSEFIGMRAGDAGPIWQSVADELRRDPDRYKDLNPPNGWGDYDGAVEVISALAAACAKHPDATVGGWL